MIVIHAKGNKDIGIGNLSRAYELISYLKEYKVIGIFECDDILFKKYKLDNILQSNSLTDSITLISKYKCSIYISDLVEPDKELSDSLRKLGVKKIVHFNSLSQGFEPDIQFITDGFDYPFEVKGMEIYRGFKYYIVGNNITKNRKKAFEPIKQIKNILICFGGADPAFYTEYFAKVIKDNKYNYTIVLGPAMGIERKEHIKSIKKDNIQYIDNPENIIEIYLSHDLLITLGGMMTYEAMCLGLPVCAVRWNYLEYIVKSFGEKKMITDLGTIDDSYSNILNLNIEEVNKIAKNAFKIIDGSALQNIKNVLDNQIIRIYNDNTRK